MSGAHLLEGTKRIRNYSNEGTAARTRPFSFEEIMQRRKNKELEADAREGEMRSAARKMNAASVGDHFKSNEVSENTKDAVVSSMKYASEDSHKLVEEKNKSKKECTHVNDKKYRDFEASLNKNIKPDRHSRNKRVKNDNREALDEKSRLKKDDRLRPDYNTEHRRRQPNETTLRDKQVVREKVSLREGKHKHHNGPDERVRSETYSFTSQKHGYIRRDEIEFSERKIQKKVSSESRYEDTKQKTRRSRSRDRDRDRNRSNSGSPRAHKHQSHHSFRESSRRDHLDADRHRHESNGSYPSGYYLRNNYRSSGLGGYSPRKRKTDAAVMTPPRTNRSPDKKSIAWDLLPTAPKSGQIGSFLTSFQAPAETKVLTTQGMLNTISMEVKSEIGHTLNNVSVTKDNSVDSIQLTQATRPQRRLYVENLPASASDKDVMKCLNDFFLLSGANHIQGTQPCISCIINKDKGQAVVEFLTAEDATSALAFDGKSLSGSIIKVRRPKDFVEASTGISEKPAPAVVTICNVVNDSPHKIFIGGISKAISSDMFMEIVESFGVLKACHFEFKKDFDKPFAFLEYADHSITLRACAGLNGMKLGGSVLTAVQALPNATGEEIVVTPPFYGIPEHARLLLENPTQVLKLQNVFDEESFSLLSEPELEETLEDIRLECARFGTVKSINIVKSNKKHNSIRVVEIHADADLQRNSQGSSSDAEKTGHEAKHQGGDLQESMQDNSSDVAEPQNVEQDVELSYEKPFFEHKYNGHDEAGQQHSVVRPEEPALPANDKDQNAVASAGGTCTKWGDTDENLEQATEELEKTASPEMDGSSAEQTDGDNINQINDDAGGVFEGCVLIEYARKEAACSAAHCLHGRLYGDRIVSAGYVPYDLYKARFSIK